VPDWRARGPAGCLARFEALPESPHSEAGQVRDAGHGELPRGQGGTATFIHGGTLVPRRRERAGEPLTAEIASSRFPVRLPAS
jgi:hypothetical protein